MSFCRWFWFLSRPTRPIRNRRLRLESLEDRTLPATINWIGGSGNWDVAANWSGGKVPGSNDDAVISTGSTATITIISGDNIQAQSVTTAANDTLSITGGSLSIAGNSTLDGALAMTGGSLTASGLGTTVLENGSTSVASASLYATAGATLSLPSLTGYTGNGSSTTLEATGTGSTLTLANLTGVTQTGTGYAAQTQFEALAGGTVNLPALQQINTGTVGLESDGAGSVLNVAALTSFAETNGWTYSTLQSSNGGTVNDGSLVSLSNVNLVVAGTGENLTLSGLTSFATANITVSGGASLSLPGVTSFTANSISTLPSTTTLEATGTGSTLTLANLASVTQTGTGYAVQTQFEALAGGTVNLPALQQINTGTVVLESDGAGSVLNVSALTSFAEANGWTSSTLQSSSGGTISDGSLASLTNVNLNVIGTEENLTLSGLTTIATANIAVATANITVSGGASLSLPGVTSYAGSGNTTTLEATGTGSTLTLANLTVVTQSANNYSAQTQFEALAGGTVNLPALQQINTGTVVLVSDGAGSVLNVSALTSFTETNGHTYSTLQSSNGGTVNDGILTGTHGIYFTDTGGSTILDGKLSSLTNVTVTLDGSDAHVADSWTKLINGSLEVDTGSYSLAGLTDVDGSSLYARDGGSLALPGLTSYASNGTFQADGTNTGTGTGSVLDVSALVTLTQTGGWTVNALTGGTVKMSSLTSLTSTQGINITDTGGSTLLDSNLATLNGVNVTLDGTDAQVGNSWTTFIKGTLSLTGGSLTLPHLTDLENSNLQLASAATLNLSTAGVATLAGNISLSGGTLTLSGSPNVENATVVASSGATLNLPGGTTYAGTATLEATGAGTTLTLTNTTLVESTNAGSLLVFEALAGGSVTMPALTSISVGPVVLLCDGAGSVINLSALQTFTSNGGATASNGGSIQSGITLPAAPDVWINPGSDAWSLASNWLLGSVPTASMNVLINTAAAATISIFSNVSVTSITLGNSDTLFIYNGIKLSTSGDFTNNGILTLGPRSKLSVGGNATESTTATISEQIDGAPADGEFGALSVNGTLTLAGTLNLTLLFGYLPSVGLDYPVFAFASASGDFSTFTGLTGQGSSITETLEATSLDLIVQPTPPYFTADTPPVAAVGSAYSYRFQANGTARITYSANGLPNWAQIDAATGTLSGTPPAVGTVNFSVTASNGIAPDATVNVSLDSELEPPVFTADSPPAGIGGSAYSYPFHATGTGNVPLTYSATGLPNWAQIDPSTGVLFGTPTADGTFNFSVTASNGISPDTTVNVSLIMAGGAAFAFNIPAGTTFSVPAGIYAGGTTFNVGAGAKVTISSGTFTGGAVFNVAPGAVVDLTGGYSASYSGTLSGSGGGTVEVGSGQLNIGNGGIRLAFSGSTFQWNSGLMFDIGGGLTNVGTMNISGNTDKDFYNDGVLDNFGTIIQTGTGNLQLGTDGLFPTTLKNEAGASYLLEGDGGLTEISDSGSLSGQTTLINAGLIRKTAGTGISTFGPAQGISSRGVFGVITNTGTIEADSGTIALTTTSGISQVSGGSLTAGTWNALNGATIAFPTGTAITSNAANLSIDGSGASISGLGGLASNSGTLSLTNGANDSTSGNFSNSGSLTLGAASTLTVGGNFSQTSAATLAMQIAGRPASGQFGQVQVAGTAKLDGTLALSVSNAFLPVAGDAYTLLTFASQTGAFSQIDHVTAGRGSQLFDVEIVGAKVTATVLAGSADLQPVSLSVPSSATLGQNITVIYTVQNNAATPTLAANWVDSIYLSQSNQIDSSAVLLGRVNHNGAVAANGQYADTLSAAIPSMPPGNYNLLLLVDSQGLVPDANRANNLLVSSSQITVGFDTLALATPATGTISAGQDIYYQLELPAAQPVQITVTGAAAGEDELAARFQAPPDLLGAVYDEHASNPATTTQTLVIPGAQAGPYYILVHGDAGAGAGAAFTITATALSFQVTGLSPIQGSNAGSATVTINGTGFTPTTTATLTQGGKHDPASTVIFQSSTVLFATFNLAGLSGGLYDLQLGDADSTTYTDPGAFNVIAGGPVGNLQLNLQTPALIRAPFTGASVTINYANTGDTDIPAPVLNLTSDNADFLSTDGLYDVGNDIEVLAIDTDGPAGILPPGYQGTLTISYQPVQLGDGVASNFSLGQLSPGAIDWSSFASTLLPSFVSSTAGNAIVTNLQNNAGSTTAELQASLDADATYLSQMGVYTSDVNRLMGFEIAKADGGYLPDILPSSVDVTAPTPGLALEIDRQFSQTIAGRAEVGRFGLGWTDNWGDSVSSDSFGNLNFQFGTSIETFIKDPSDGTYFNPAAGSGTVTVLFSGHVELLLPGHTLFDFNPNGTLNFIQDSNSNRITCGYDPQGQLTRLSGSNGSTLTLAYNVQGFVSQITDASGRITSYGYDATGHLIQVSALWGTDQYTYATNAAALALNNALTSATYNSSAAANYSYDSEGRLTGFNIGGQEQATVSYGLAGGFTVTDADNIQTNFLFDDSGNIRQLVDPLGHVTQYVYDDNQNLVKTIFPDGTVSTQVFDGDGNVVESTDPLGNQVHFSFDSTFDQLTGVTDANGHTTSYAIDPNTGNVDATTYADGTSHANSYDSVGNLIQSFNGGGQATQYTHDSDGRLTGETFSDGTTASYGYDSAGNLVSATNSVGTFTLVYDTAGDLLQIDYPGGAFLKFTYNAIHQRTQSVDQTGFTVNYVYNSIGQLTQLTDANGNNIVTYNYDPAGRLMEKLNGNGTSTTYQYDADGDLLSIINLAADGKTVNSEFDYAYDRAGRVISMTTASQTTTYGYNADGELTLVSMPGGRTIQYQYDAAGNRVQVVDSTLGTTAYTTDDMNEYTQVGDTSYQYDADGNLIAQTQNGVTTSYAYNSLDQLITLLSPTADSTYQYDPFGLQYSATVSGQAAVEQRDYSNLGIITDQLDGSGTVLAHYTAALGVVSETTSNQASYYFDADNAGNVVGITDSSGSYVNQYQYLPFGETQVVKSSIANPLTFGGMNFDITQSSGLVTMGFRQYDAAEGRFMENDPLGLGGGDTNTLRYVGNDPVNANDALGLWATLEISGGLTPHAQFFFHGGLIFIRGKEVSNIGFGAPPGEHGGLHYAGGLTGTGVLGSQTDRQVNDSDYRVIQQYADSKALASAIIDVYSQYQLNGVQFQLYDGHWVEEALLDFGFDSAHFYPKSLDDFTRHDNEYDLYYNPYTNHVSNCQEFAWWVNFYYTRYARQNQANGKQIDPCDPNDIVGPTGVGPNQVVVPGQTLPYEIQFQNEPTASAPAQNVVVTDQLDPNLDWSTFQLGSIGFGNYSIQVPAGLSSYHTVVDATSDLGVLVDILVTLDSTTGLVTWTFRSLDPNTLDTPLNPLAGFLPADNTTGIGDGFIKYTIEARTGLTGTPVANAAAAVVFDTNPPLDTMTISNPIDAGYPADQMIIQAPSQIVAGGKLILHVVAAGASGAPDILYNGSIALTVSGVPTGGKLSGALVAPVVNGVATFSLTPSVTGSYTLFASSTSDLTGVTASVQVVAAPQLTVTLVPVQASNSSAGQQFNVTVKALLNGKLDTAYAGTLHLTSSDPQAVLPADLVFAPGSGTDQFTVTLESPGKQTVSVVDTSRFATSGTSNPITVSPLPTTATHLALAVGSITSPMGTEEMVTFAVTPLDGTNKVAALQDFIHFRSSDPRAVLPAETVFVGDANGAMTFSVILNTPGKQTITVIDTARPSIAGTVTVTSGGTIDHFNITGFPIAAVGGAAHPLTITAVDPFNRIVANYTGTVQLTDSEPGFTPMVVTFAAANKGVVTIPVTLATPGGHALMGIDANKIFGSAAVTVVSPATHLVALAQNSAGANTSAVAAGSQVTVTVTALTAANKSDTQFADALQVVSSDKQAVITPGPLVNGVQMFTITLATAGKQTVTVTDLSRPGLKVSPLVIAVSPAAVSQLSVTGFPSSTLSGVAHRFTVTAEDRYGNPIKNGYADTVSVAGSTYTFGKADAGAHVFAATLTAPGIASLTATDTSNANITAGTEGNITVLENVTASVAPPSFDLTGQATGVPGQPLPFTLNASQSGIPASTAFNYKIDWNGNGKTVQTVSGQTSLTLNHVYTATGTYTIKLTVLDAAGDVLAHGTQSVTIDSVALEADPADNTNTALAIGTPATGGTVVITPSTDISSVAVSINGSPVQIPTPPSSVGHMLIYGQGAKAVIKEMTANINGQTVEIAIPAVIFGGNGTDVLNVSGSSADNILVGGAGSDSLTGGSGSDILIGGGGADTLRAGSGGDILIGGSTTYDANAAALLALMAEWGSADSYSQRVQDLFGNGATGQNGGTLLNAQTVVRDSAVNQLFGGTIGASDWFWLSAGTKTGNYGEGEVTTFE